jgi:MscS family membrane protein
MEFLDRLILDNSIRNILIVVGVIAFVFLLKKTLSKSVASLLFIAVSSIWKKVDRKQFVTLVFKPMSWLLSITVALIALNKLNYPSAWQFHILKWPFQVILQKIGVIIWIVSFIKLLLSLVDFVSLFMEKKALDTPNKGDDQLVSFLRDFIKVITWIAGILLLINVVFNQSVGYLLTGISIVGAALALSAKESLENLIASFIIFFDKPFYVGDTVKVNTITGAVEHIGLRSTRIRTADKTLVTVPNKQMVDSVVDNWSMRSGRRVEIKLELSDKTSAEMVTAFIESIREYFSQKHQPVFSANAFLSDYNKNGLTVIVEYFTAPIPLQDFNDIKQAINLVLIELVKTSAIELASNSSNLTIVNNDHEPEGVKNRPII